MFSTNCCFTPPTCTLEIEQRKLSLSDWKSKNATSRSRFKLKFDDPRKPATKQVTIRGGARDLVTLQQVVDGYLRTYLQTSFSADNSRQELTLEPQSDNLPYLKPQGLTNHELFFGSLDRDCDGNSITLSTTQLFDLVTAFEAYQHQINSNANVTSPHRSIPLWGSIAALTIAAVGIVSILLKSPLQQNTASISQPQAESETQPQKKVEGLDEIASPSVANGRKKSQPQLKDPLASSKKLPPPPAVDAPKPKPDIPDPADYPLADVARQSGFGNSDKQKSNNRPNAVIVPEKPESERSQLSQNEVNNSEAAAEDSSIVLSQNENIAKNSDLASGNSPQQSDRLQEIADYFQDKWQPPADLKQSLEYRLYLNKDGAIAKVVPLGKAARLYLSQTNIPVKGEPFISPGGKSKTKVIRLLLNPDGGIKVFEE